MSDIYANLKKLIKFPSVISFRVIVDAEAPDAIAEVKKAVEEIEHSGVMEITEPPRRSRNGTYISYTLPVKVTSAKNLEAIYKIISMIPSVKHVI
ncbi:MAG: DUF493 domain-containing protein [Succinivibrio sp.]|nr:DUF493 domain-containing protein [Succinivibrio sp.]